MEREGNGAQDSKLAISNAETVSNLQADDTMVNTTSVKSLNPNDPGQAEMKINQEIDSKSKNLQDINTISDINTNGVQCSSREGLSEDSEVKDNNNTIKEENPTQDIKPESTVSESIEATTSEEQNQTSTVSTTSRREKCKYGRICYRKNPQHKRTFSHPGDADYDLPDDREECPYGKKCYRKNLLHRSHYKHTRLYPRRKCAQNGTSGTRAKKSRRDDSALDDLFDDESEEESVDESEYDPTESEGSDWEDELNELQDDISD